MALASRKSKSPEIRIDKIKTEGHFNAPIHLEHG